MSQCIMCGGLFSGSSWKHPDEECQDCFIDTGRESLYFEVDDPDTIDIVACSESCWREFMILSWENKELL